MNKNSKYKQECGGIDRKIEEIEKKVENGGAREQNSKRKNRNPPWVPVMSVGIS